MLRPWDLQIVINPDCVRPVYVQIADAFIKAITSGKLRSGDALPGSRQLATTLGLNRNTIVEALDMLIDEGWLVARQRRGLFVAGMLPCQYSNGSAQETLITRRPVIVFDDGLPDSRIAPINELAGAYRQIFNQKGRWQLMGYSDGSVDHEFRSAIARMLNFTRGMRLSANDLLVTRGSQMAMYLSAHCLIEKGDQIIVENPGYKPAWKVFESAGAHLVPVPVDSEGIIVDDIKKHLGAHRKIKGVFLTPNYQYPTTATLSSERRKQLIALSNRYGFTIIEDDYDSEFHFDREPPLPLSSYEDVKNYIYIGTMSKMVSPALRIGYLASSHSFVDKAAQMRKLIDVQGDHIMAQAILQLIEGGHIKRHLKRATVVYKERRDFFETSIRNILGDSVRFTKPSGGLAFWLEPAKQVDLQVLRQTLLQKGIQIISPQDFSFDKPTNGLRLGYASLTPGQIDEGLNAISMAL
jgi:GntR family transcriptional regulator / MocR family aminotransferase